MKYETQVRFDIEGGDLDARALSLALSMLIGEQVVHLNSQSLAVYAKIIHWEVESFRKVPRP